MTTEDRPEKSENEPARQSKPSRKLLIESEPGQKVLGRYVRHLLNQPRKPTNDKPSNEGS
jgi:hypothetical protein